MEEEIKETKSEKDELSFKVQLQIGSDIKTLYANEVAVQTLHSEVVLSFFEVRLPLLLMKDSENKAVGQCVGRVAMPLGRIPAFIEALDSQFSSYVSDMDALKKVEGEANNDDSNSK